MRKSIPKSYDYIENLLPRESDKMRRARKNSEKLGLDSISLSLAEAQLMAFQLQAIAVEKVVEIGTLTGLSALHILNAIPEKALLITLEKSEQHAKLAEEVLSEEIQKGRCQILVGDARENLKILDSQGPFDAVFIDGNKAAYLEYFQWALANVRVGGLILVDNIFLSGAVWGGETRQNFNPKQIDAVQKLNRLAFSELNLNSVIIPTEEGMLMTRIGAPK